MLSVTTMPMPGVLRLRALHPLIEGDGSCSLVYDLERAAVVEVPEELQFHIAPALETGDLDEALVGWLVNEDLLTGEGGTDGSWVASAAASSELAGWWNPGAVYCIDGELHARIDRAREESALEIVRFVFQHGFGTGRIKLHLSWGGSYPGNGLMERIVVEASRLAGRLGQEITFELTLDAAQVTPARADFLAGYAFQVRLLCGSFPAFVEGRFAKRPLWSAEPVVRLLVDRLGDRLTVHCMLDRGRLLDLWEWAKGAGIRHLDVTTLEDSAIGDGMTRPGRLRELRNDLLALSEEMGDQLAAQRLPVDYKPLTRIVDRLMRSELPESCHEPGSFAGALPIADSYPRAFLERFDVLSRGALETAAGEELETAELPCHGCWARHVCGHSAYLAAAPEGEEGREFSEDGCALWRTEVEVALRFYHRLAHMDPLQVRRFFTDLSREPASAPGLREDLGHLGVPF